MELRERVYALYGVDRRQVGFMRSVVTRGGVPAAVAFTNVILTLQ